ncbi:NTP transferase domain-containing protein [Brachybacterium sp. P6-10-X1]|uniref:nucleotidyltransferase family protein n=1 Tax=Brachybacterium sp. P6-10-X1 TaxID=1903186 RepID=UPI0020A3D50D|nr:NTP transferase domain-containing protein [Brachybacterium sp. P6-10-X1]
MNDDAPVTGARPLGLVLAAGSGTRLGRGPKALLPHDGGSLVEHVVRALLDGGCTEAVVVVGAGAGEVRGVLAAAAGVRCVQNPQWRAGMGSSLRIGLADVGPGRDVLVTPVDRPGLSAAAVRRVVAAHRGDITVAAHRDGAGRLQRGHPVLLGAAWTAAAAAAAHDDVGARELLAARQDRVQWVDCSDLEDGADVDLPTDLWRLSQEGRAALPPRR